LAARTAVVATKATGSKPGRWSRRLVAGENALFAARALDLAKERGAIQPKPLAHWIESNLMARRHDRWRARHKSFGGLLADAPPSCWRLLAGEFSRSSALKASEKSNLANYVGVKR
jgi:hypothetical protein